MTMTDTPLVVPQSKITTITKAVREAGDLLRAGDNAADLQMVHTSAAERIHFALGHLLELVGFAWTPEPEPQVILGPIVPEMGETRDQWMREHGMVHQPSPLARDDETIAAAAGIEVVLDPTVPRDTAYLVQEGSVVEIPLPPVAEARDATKVLGFVTYGDTGLSPDELDAVRRAAAADPVVIEGETIVHKGRDGTVFIPVESPLGQEVLAAAGLEVEVGEPEVAPAATEAEPWPCKFCDRDDFPSWQSVCGHMRGKHKESPLRRDYETWKAEGRTPS